MHHTAKLFTAAIVGFCLSACGDPASDGDASSSNTTANSGGSSADGNGGHSASGGSGGNNAGSENPFLSDCEEQTVATAISAETAEVNGLPFLYAAGESPTRLLLMFHGGGGDKEDYFANRIETVLIAKHALQNNYAIAALDSAAHLNPSSGNQGGKHKWNLDDTANNVDVVNAIAMIKRLRDVNDLGVVAADAPVYLMGASHGGSIVSRLAQHTTVAAAVVYISNASVFHTDGALIPPVVLVPGANDPGQALGSNQDLKSKIEAANGAVELHINEPQALSAGLFMRIPGIDCDLSKAIGQSLSDQGWLDEQWKLAFDPKVDTSWSGELPATATTYDEYIRDVLIETYAGHSPSSDLNPEVFAFLEAH